jgi:peptidoglycan-associated lipoprotein
MKHPKLMTLAAALTGACSQQRPETAAAPAVDTTTLRAERAAIARADSVRRADSLAALTRSRAERVRLEVQEGGMDPGEAVSIGLPAEDSVTLYGLINFDFNSARIDQRYDGALEAKLRVLQSWPRLMIRIGGHCDDRGADEYNLALGQRRAAAVKRWLVDRGIAESRIEIVSYGEEQPLVQAENESAWAQNRRADFVATRPAR